ncbi:hypothetical protein LINGRAHAP2_LOCUS23705 [Linum grandiflorum]
MEFLLENKFSYTIYFRQKIIFPTNLSTFGKNGTIVSLWILFFLPPTVPIIPVLSHSHRLSINGGSGVCGSGRGFRGLQPCTILESDCTFFLGLTMASPPCPIYFEMEMDIDWRPLYLAGEVWTVPTVLFGQIECGTGVRSPSSLL